MSSTIVSQILLSLVNRSATLTQSGNIRTTDGIVRILNERRLTDNNRQQVQAKPTTQVVWEAIAPSKSA